MTDQELIAAYAEGDVEAFRAFYERHKSPFYSYLANRAPLDVDDIFQEAFMKFVDAAAKKPIEHPKAYLYMIGLNLMRNLGRRPKDLSLDEAGEVEDESAALPALDAEVDAAAAKDALRALADAKPRFYDVVHLHLFEDMTFDEIGAVLERNRNTVTAQYRYGLQYLRRYIGESHG